MLWKGPLQYLLIEITELIKPGYAAIFKVIVHGMNGLGGFKFQSEADYRALLSQYIAQNTIKEGRSLQGFVNKALLLLEIPLLQTGLFQQFLSLYKKISRNHHSPCHLYHKLLPSLLLPL